MPKFLVSIIIPSYNHERYILRAINSALAQRTPDLAIELIIIDDGSTDNTRKVIAGLQNEDIHIIYQENCGTASTISRGLSIAQGSFVAILNSDDVYHDGRLLTLIRAMENDPDCYLALSKVKLIDNEGTTITEGVEFEWLQKCYEAYKTSNDFILSVLIDNFICTSSNFVFRKSLIEKIGLFRNLRYVNDLDFLLRAIISFKFVYFNQELLSYRIHGGNTIKEKNIFKADFIFEVSWVIATLMENDSIYRRISIKKLVEVLLVFYPSNIEAIFFISFYLKNFADKEKLLDDGQPRACIIKAINKKIKEFEYIKELEKGRDFFVNTKVPEYERRIEELTKKYERRVEELTKKYERRVEELTNTWKQLQREYSQLADEINHLRHQNYEIWAERNWFQSQLESVLRSRRYRLIEHLLEIKSLKNIKYNLISIAKIILPVKFKEKLKKLIRRDIFFKHVQHFLKKAYHETYKIIFPPKKYYQKKYYGPLVSIISPCFNYGKYLDSFIACLQEQTFKNFEVIIVDDGSTDSLTVEKINQLEMLSLDNFHIVRQNNEGVISARNKAVDKARGKYIFALDPDDTIDKTYLEKSLLYLESAPTNIFAYSWTYSTGEVNFIWQTRDTDPVDILNENRAGFTFLPKEAFIKVGGYNQVMREGYEDWELTVNLVQSGYFGKVIPEPLYYYYVKKGSRNFLANRKHEQLKRLIRDLHQQYLFSHKRELRKYHRQEFIVTNPLVNLTEFNNDPAKKYFLVDLDKLKACSADILANLMSYSDLENYNILVICDQRWIRFFHLNTKPQLFVYYPDNYNYSGDKVVIYDYLRLRYRPCNLAIENPPSTPSSSGSSDKINILYIAPWLIPGGADIATIDWFTQLDGKLFNKYFITTEPRENTWILDIKGFAKEIYELSTLSCNDPKKIEYFVSHLISLKKIHVVHIMNSRTGYDLLPVIKKQFPKVLTVTQFHCFDYLENGDRVGYPCYVPMNYDAYIDYYNVVSQSLQQEILDLFPCIDEKKFQVIYCCIDTDKFNPVNVQENPQILVNRRLDKLNILFIGRLDRQKQPLVMVQVAQVLKKKDVPFLIHILGEGSLESQQKELENHIRQNNLSENIIIHGGQSREMILNWYKVGDVLLMTSAWEGIPIVLYEAMSMGLTCVAPDLGGIKELVNNECGFIVDDCRNVQQYVNMIEMLYRDHDLREKMGKKSRERCIDKFNIENMKRSYEKFYVDIVDSSVHD